MTNRGIFHSPGARSTSAGRSGDSCGSLLHVRLTAAVGSFASRAGSPIHAVLIAPVEAHGKTVLPAGATLTGNVRLVRRVGFGVVHECAELDLDFKQLTTPEGKQFPVSTQVTEVDNGREQVDREGRIRGVRSTSSVCFRASGYIRTLLLWNIHAHLAYWVVRSLIVQVPEPEIYYPAGSELTLALTRPLAAPDLSETDNVVRDFTGEERRKAVAVVAATPFQTSTVRNRPSDLINVMLVGSRQQVAQAFTAAGWTPPRVATFRSSLREIRAVAEETRSADAPMSSLLLNENESDMCWQKGLNDSAKRHHIRIWKQAGTWDGREIWFGAATQDIDLAYFRAGHLFTHKVARDVDRERDKIVEDLAFTSCVDMAGLSDRPQVPHLTSNGTGDPMTTDGRLAVLQLNDCSRARPFVAAGDQPPLPMHGSRLQRFGRREILSFRSDLIRGNPYWRGYEVIRMAIVAMHRYRDDPLEGRPGLALASAPPHHLAADLSSVVSLR